MLTIIFLKSLFGWLIKLSGRKNLHIRQQEKNKLTCILTHQSQLSYFKNIILSVLLNRDFILETLHTLLDLLLLQIAVSSL